jgi:putative transposase
VNAAHSESELEAIRRSVIRGTPYGSESWVTQSAARLQLKHTLRPKGRPKKKSFPTKPKQ